ncbi:MAG: MBL fold metallo-hydrolase [Candidatus Thorarchaeota archaeon]
MEHLETISSHVAAITSGWSGGNAGAVALENFTIAIDTTNSPERGKTFRAELDAHFGLPVKYTLLTHHHSDHASGLDGFGDTSIISSKQTAKKIQNLTRVHFYPTIIIDRMHQITDGDYAVEIYHSGGHTSDSSYLYFPQEKIVFVGDLVFEGYLFFAGYQSDPNKWIEAMEQIKKLNPRKIIPGHGPVLEKATSLDKHITLLRAFRDSILDAVSEKKDPKTMDVPEFVFEVSKRLPKEELVKWFRRTAISWFRKV